MHPILYNSIVCVFEIIFHLNLNLRSLISLQQNKYYRKYYYIDGISVIYQTAI